jgi:hypothetical protein
MIDNEEASIWHREPVKLGQETSNWLYLLTFYSECL